MYIPRNLWLFLPDTVSSPKWLAIVSINFLSTSSSMCYTLLSSTYHYIVYWFPFMVLFSMQLSYGLTANSCDFIVFEYRLYLNSEGSMHTYRAFSSRRYINFTPFSKRTSLLCSGLTLRMMYKNSTSIFRKISFSSGIPALRYDPWT